MFSDYGTQNFKQHLNLSQSAFDVIQNDMRAFTGRENFSGFINSVIEAYSAYAEASIFTTLRRKEAEYFQLFDGIPDDKTRQKIIQILLSHSEKELISKATSHARGVGTKFRLNKRNFQMIFDGSCPEEKYYKRPGQYIKAIIEEYAEKPQYQRERTFFGETITLIKSSIESGTLLVVHTKKDVVYEVRPYAVMTDDGSLYHYLVGFSRLAKSHHAYEKIASFRISQLEYVSQRPKSYRSGRITSNEREQIAHKLQAEGVQFLLGEQTEIAVRLTRAGKKMYASQLHLRPMYTRITGDDESIYHFQCTEAQARYYFFKFGKEAEILKPESLRNAFIRQYREALGAYEGTQAAPNDSE